MMFVFGEVSDPLQETTLLVEDIIRSQVIEIVHIDYNQFPSTHTFYVDYTSCSTSESKEFQTFECRRPNLFNAARSRKS